MKMLLRCTGAPAVLSAALLLIVMGCTERDSPLGGAPGRAGNPVTATFSFDELKLNDMNDPPSRTITMAYASDQDPTVPQQPFPVLYLLHDYQGDSKYFERYNLQALLTDMFKKGEIGRMMVVTVDASNALGGSYFRNSGTLGNYEDVLTSTIAFVERSARIYTQGGRHARAISGHGMGGYGAFRYAIDRPEMFGSVSSMSGPLSMGEPDGNFGVWTDLIPAVFDENGIVVGQPDVYERITAGRLNPTTQRFMAMTSAFSPHPLRRFDSLGDKIGCHPWTGCAAKDTFHNVPFFSPLAAGPQTLKITDIGATLGVGLDMLFDSVGNRSDEVWSRWKDTADVKTVFAARRAADPMFFDSVAMFFDVGADDEFGFREQNEDFDRYLRTEAGISNYEFEVYEGYGDVPPGHSQLIGTRLREIIKFHDKHLVRPPAPPK